MHLRCGKGWRLMRSRSIHALSSHSCVLDFRPPVAMFLCQLCFRPRASLSGLESVVRMWGPRGEDEAIIGGEEESAYPDPDSPSLEEIARSNQGSMDAGDARVLKERERKSKRLWGSRVIDFAAPYAWWSRYCCEGRECVGKAGMHDFFLFVFPFVRCCRTAAMVGFLSHLGCGPLARQAFHQQVPCYGPRCTAHRKQTLVV